MTVLLVLEVLLSGPIFNNLLAELNLQTYSLAFYMGWSKKLINYSIFVMLMIYMLSCIKA